jgi:hypothetical protein
MASLSACNILMLLSHFLLQVPHTFSWPSPGNEDHQSGLGREYAWFGRLEQQSTGRFYIEGDKKEDIDVTRLIPAAFPDGEPQSITACNLESL